ncbi:perlucin-like protein [Mytilus edulis]|uniref:perlucin-like protein n=1 Tax=Mytilus edulis TaxID=6550 RepID=UPI0039F08DDF
MTIYSMYFGIFLILGLIEFIRASCPTTGWTHVGDSCYLFNWEKMSWSEAMEWCKSKGGYLAELNTKEENNQIQQLASIRHQPSVTHIGYVSARDMKTEGQWVWENSGTPVTFTDWWPGEPNVDDAAIEDCLTLFSSLRFKWLDNDYQKLRRSICEIKLSKLLKLD